MYNIYNIHKHTLTLSGGHVMPVAEMIAPVDGGTERVGGGHMMSVAVMVILRDRSVWRQINN